MQKRIKIAIRFLISTGLGGILLAALLAVLWLAPPTQANVFPGPGREAAPPALLPPARPYWQQGPLTPTLRRGPRPVAPPVMSIIPAPPLPEWVTALQSGGDISAAANDVSIVKTISFLR